MILAAGVGERMRPLTDHTPKPLLRVGGVPLIEHHIRRLAQAGFRDLVINVSHLARQIIEYCGDGSRWGVSIVYSPEDAPLETAGGIVKALPLLGREPFLVVNGDIWIDFPFAGLAGCLPAAGAQLAAGAQPAAGAHLVFVDNPPQHPRGDFRLDGDGRVHALRPQATGLTYAGVAVFAPAFFAGLAPDKLPLRPLLDAAIGRGSISGEYHIGWWEDVGTPQRLRQLDAAVRASV